MMPFQFKADRLFRNLTVGLALGLLLPRSTGWSGELVLKDGTVLRGTLETPIVLRGDQQATTGFLRVDDGLRRITIHDKLRDRWSDVGPVTSPKPFRIRQPMSGRNPYLVIGHLVSIVSISPFDEFGRRTFTVKDSRGETAIPQGITEINPEYIKVESLKHMWESSISTQSVPPSVVEQILRRSLDQNNVDDRLRLVRFFLATEWFIQAGNELKAIEHDFPDLREEVREASQLLEEAKSRRRLNEIKLRRGAGQHSFAYQQLRNFMLDGAPGETVVEVRELSRQYDMTIERLDLAKVRLEKLLGGLDAQQHSRLAPAIGELLQYLQYENIARLDSFLTVVDREDVSAEEKLATAISGWVAGNAFAEPNLDRAMLLWESRAKIAGYLTEPNELRRQQLMAAMKSEEAISVDLAARVVEHLLPLVPTGPMETDKATRITLATDDGRQIPYWIALPPEYTPFRSYPVMVTLHGRGVSPETQLSWWTAAPAYQASRHGYIVVAPEYLEDSKKDYEFNASAHDAVLHTLIDVRRRFSVDSDRIFLSGHSMGADAAWDIGLAHPDLFAGVIPVCGAPQKFAEFYWQNAQHTSFYIIEGEKDGTNPEQNTKTMRRMMENGYDVLYVEFKGRGHEDLSDEIIRVFDWMSRKTRRKFPLKFTCRTARPTDNEFFFVALDDFVPAVMMDPLNFDRKKFRMAAIEGRINGLTNSISITLTGAKQAEVWISPGMLELDRPITVRVNREEASGKMVRADIETLLEDFRIRGDRQKLFYARVRFARL